MVRERVSAEATHAGAAQLFQQIAQLAEAAAHATRQALVAEAVIPAKVLFAAVEQFDDSFLRSSTALEELYDVTEAYVHDIWPGRFAEREVSTLRLREAGRARADLLQHLSSKRLTHG